MDNRGFCVVSAKQRKKTHTQKTLRIFRYSETYMMSTKKQYPMCRTKSDNLLMCSVGCVMSCCMYRFLLMKLSNEWCGLFVDAQDFCAVTRISMTRLFIRLGIVFMIQKHWITVLFLCSFSLVVCTSFYWRLELRNRRHGLYLDTFSCTRFFALFRKHAITKTLCNTYINGKTVYLIRDSF